MPIDVSLQIPAGLLTSLHQHLFPPTVTFGSPVQRAKDVTRSWWHIPVTIQKKWKIGSASLPAGSEIFLDRHSEKNGFSDGFRMRWGDAIFSDPDDRATLVVGEVILVPVAYREEGAAEAFLTDARFFKGDRACPLEPNRVKNRFRLRVKSRGKTIACSGPYLVRVPAVESNGHFVCEVEYEGEGSRRL